ncbi:MAG TPA: PAS domain S-box protein [Balneolaceae bacterium]|nr:PAS domain S-box protein [Balneolaceae bacterium]
MNKSARKSHDKEFKTRLALEALKRGDLSGVAEEYSVPASKIRNWTRQLINRADLSFNSERTAKQDLSITKNPLLNAVLEASPNGIVVTDLNRDIIAYNQQCLEMWNIPEQMIASEPPEKIRRHVLDQLKNPGKFKKKIRRLEESRDLLVHDILHLNDGRFFEWHSVPYRENGNLIGRATTIIDITKYKKTEKKLSRFGNLLESINANVNEAILRSTPENGLIYVNDAFVEMFGYDSKEDALATDPADFYADEDKRWELLDLLRKEGQFQNIEVLFKRKDGSTFWGLENSTQVEEDGTVYIDGVVTNVNNWKEAKQALRKSEEKYRNILKNIEEGYFEMDLAGNFTFFNDALVEMMGYPADKMMGMNNREYMDEENAEKVYQTFNRVFRTNTSAHGFDWELICGDGSIINVEASITLRKDSEGNPIGFSGMMRDITERKRKEKQIRDSLREKKVLLGEIHHRVKNNLAIISSLLYLQAEKIDEPTVSKALMESQNRINSMALIHELLYDEQKFTDLNPQEYIEKLVRYISANLEVGSTNITTEIETSDFDLEMKKAIPCALIINELTTNAYKYAFEGREEGTVKIIFNRNENGRYHLEVSDNGCGLPHNFDLDDESDNGLGMSLIQTLTRQLEGVLRTENNRGARFVITFGE